MIKINGIIKSFTVSATSTTPLTMYDVRKTHANHRHTNSIIAV